MNRRGQLLLLGALALAAVIVSLAIVLNAAVFTDSLASRGATDVSNGGTVTSVGEVRHGVAALVVAANAGGSSYADREDALNSSIDEFDDSLQRYYAERDRFVRISSLSYDKGTNVSQSSPGNFTKPSGSDPSWELTSSSPSMRRFRMTADSGLASSKSDAFKINITDGSSTDWTIFVYKNGGTPRVAVESSGTAGTIGKCTATNMPMSVDITGGTVAGEYCHALAVFNKAVHDYTIEYANGDQIQGTYHVVLPADPGTATNSIESTVVYNVTLDLWYRSVRTDYESNMTVAPGEMR